MYHEKHFVHRIRRCAIYQDRRTGRCEMCIRDSGKACVSVYDPEDLLFTEDEEQNQMCIRDRTFTAAKPEIQVKDVQETVREELQILKNGWGPVSLKVQTEDDFLFLEKNRIGEDDFLGNLCRLPVYISEENLHDGKNFGTVTVCLLYTSSLCSGFI